MSKQSKGTQSKGRKARTGRSNQPGKSGKPAAAKGKRGDVGGPSGRRSRGLLLLLGLAIVAGAVLIVVLTTRGGSPVVTMPRSPDDLEPQIVDYLRSFIGPARANPTDAGAHAELGLVYEANQLWPEARDSFRTAMTLDDTEPLIPYHLAIAYGQLGEIDEMLRLLDEIVVDFPDFAPAHHRRGTVLIDLGRIDEALAAFERTTQLAPDQADGFVGIADVRLRRGDHAGAARLLQQALQLDERNKTARYLLGLAYQGMGQTDAAKRELELGQDAGETFIRDEWTKQLPTHGKGLSRQMRRAIAFMNAGRHAEAAAFLEEALVWHSDDVDLMNNLAICYMRMPDLPRAREILMKALTANDQRYATYVNLASYELRSNDPATALQYADRAVELSPNVAMCHMMRSRALQALNRPEEARDALEEVVRLDPGNVTALLQLGRVAASLGDADLALTSYAAAIKRSPRHVAAHVGHADALLRLGRVDEARAAAAQARQLSPNDPEVIAVNNRINQVLRQQ